MKKKRKEQNCTLNTQSSREIITDTIHVRIKHNAVKVGAKKICYGIEEGIDFQKRKEERHK